MSSRYPPPARDRSPPRYDRRPSGTYGSLGSSYRGPAEPAPLSSDRLPPRGPKADFRGGGFSGFTPAGRGRGGFPARAGDAWDRDRDRDRERERERERESRPGPQSYRGRDDDRLDWSRRDREFGGAADRGRDARPYVGRDRSASPLRARRDSRESLPSTFGRPSDTTSSYYAPATRGGLGRGRGRGDWDRTRGRTSFVGERDRDLFAPRSRSRESWRERDRDFDRGRPPISEAERGERRHYDRSRERETRARDRDLDSRPREPSPTKTFAADGSVTAKTPSSAIPERPSKPEFDNSKRPGAPATPAGALREGRREGEQADYFGPRSETTRRDPPANTPQSSAAGGLDYGPPPSIPLPTTSPTERPAAPRPQAPKQEPIATSSPTFQPPSGPKATRASIPTSLPVTKNIQPHDAWPRTDPALRSVRPSQTPKTHSHVDVQPKKEEAVVEQKPPTAPAADRQMPPNVPSGPRLGSAPLYKQRMTSTEPAPPVQPPSAPREAPKPTTFDAKPMVIPTGPRLDREASRPLPGTASGTGRHERDVSRPSPGTGLNAPRAEREASRQLLPSGSNIWMSSDYKSKPSIMNALNKPLQPDLRDRQAFTSGSSRQPGTFHSPSEKARGLQESHNDSLHSIPLGPKVMSTSPRVQESKTLVSQLKRSIEEPHASEDIEMSAPASSEDEDEVEDDSFDEDYFAESEERHKKEMDLLEVKKPPATFEDPYIVSLLVRLQFLGMVLQDTSGSPITPATINEKEPTTVATLPTGLPSPDRGSQDVENRLLEDGQDEVDERESPHPKGRPLKQPPVNPIPTPPIEDLPYRTLDRPERIVFEDSDNEVEHEAVTTLLQQEFERNAWDWRSDLEDMHAEYRRRYPMWRHEIMSLDHERRELHASPAPASPAPSAAPSVTPSLTHERTRGARNTTEADLQAAILMSQQSLKEEEERREREAASSSLPNLDLEAVVPPMLKPADAELLIFKDTNRSVPDDLALDIFAYVPPEDDFTEEEQELFIQAYCLNPKKWGKIAESIPNRTYQDCIIHYYLTKNKTRYKDLWRRAQPRRKKREKAATKPRSTALMSELVDGEDGDTAQGAVTESGRPRRAAAPTFGDPVSEADSSTPAPQSKKLTAALKDGSAEPSTAKPTRGRKAGTATKVRRTKAQIQADQQALLLQQQEASLDKPATTTKTERGRTLIRPENNPIGGDLPPLEDAQRPIEVPLPPYPTTDPSFAAQTIANSATVSHTSYWSVPEQNKFPELLKYYGRDFAAIADFMKTKSQTMIKNYFVRQLSDPKNEFDRFAQMGDQARLEGKIPDQPPSPIAPAKRRYDHLPPAPSIPRPPQVEQVVVDSDAIAPAIKAGVIEEFPRGKIERSSTGEIISNPRIVAQELARETPLSGPSSAKLLEHSRLANDRSNLFGPKSLHGPRTGIFQEETHGFQQARQNLRLAIDERSPQLLPQHPLSEIPRSDINHASSTPTLAQAMLGQRERDVMAQQPQLQIPGMPIARAPSSQSDKYGKQPTFRPAHSRNTSLTGPSAASLEHAQDLASLRRTEIQRPVYSATAAVSPAPTPTVTAVSQPPRPEIPQATQPPPTAEAPKKRSNLFGLLNDDPGDPPPKRPSLEPPKRQSIMSPQVAPGSIHQPSVQQPRSQVLPEDDTAMRGGGSRGLYSMGGGFQAASGQPAPQEFSTGFSATPAKDPNDPWMARFDPRNQSTPSEQQQRTHHHSPAPGPYSVVPPVPQATNGPSPNSLRAETPRSMERSGLDHRRTLLSGIGPIPHAPSPPPQQLGPSGVPPYRSASGGSHTRGGSMSYAAGPTAGQGNQLNQQQVPPSHPSSTGTTPVPSLHHRAQSSLDYSQPRLTIQQHIAQQKQQEQQQQHREHERQMQRQREIDFVQRDREREREQQQQQQQQQHLLRRDPYAVEHHPPTMVSRHNQLSTAANQNHIAFGQREIPRTFTPPHSHTHGHSPYGGPGSAPLGHPHGLPPQAQHPHPHPHSHQHQHQHQHQGPPPPNQPQGAGQPPPHQMHHHVHQPQPSNSIHPGAAGHFRGLSQGGDPRRDERR
ncbi:hypothetical protein PV08_05509 [Exophiala spinifera]|uniref:SANT domain-containing protein n=1 Tax=Exophiala spinifera TaxID=91928 RepID=A0A0D2B983_9EURO|nr:uncharacterized protein PV08_05509 [Exophiala spinifera]KIW15463.1 hypothetical protein PV08_05509 [Exophiala spinifera]